MLNEPNVEMEKAEKRWASRFSFSIFQILEALKLIFNFHALFLSCLMLFQPMTYRNFNLSFFQTRTTLWRDWLMKISDWQLLLAFLTLSSLKNILKSINIFFFIIIVIIIVSIRRISIRKAFHFLRLKNTFSEYRKKNRKLYFQSKFAFLLNFKFSLSFNFSFRKMILKNKKLWKIETNLLDFQIFCFHSIEQWFRYYSRKLIIFLGSKQKWCRKFQLSNQFKIKLNEKNIKYSQSHSSRIDRLNIYKKYILFSTKMETQLNKEKRNLYSISFKKFTN